MTAVGAAPFRLYPHSERICTMSAQTAQDIHAAALQYLVCRMVASRMFCEFLRQPCCSLANFQYSCTVILWQPFKSVKDMPKQTVLTLSRRRRTVSTLLATHPAIIHIVVGSKMDLLKKSIRFVCLCCGLRPIQPNGVMSSAVNLPNHTFTGQA